MPFDKFIEVRFPSLTSGNPAVSVPESKGRNGYIKTIGVELYTNELDNIVRISPITSQGQVSPAAHVAVPFHKKELLALAAKFTELAEVAPDIH